jgi:phosphatidylglycerol lysyltransferase
MNPIETVAISGRSLRRLTGVAVAIAVAALGLTVAYQLTVRLDYHELLHAMRDAGPRRIGVAVAAAAASFLALLGRDVCALRFVQQRPPWSAVLIASFCGNALGNAVGFGALTGGAIRYRIYSSVGLKPEAVARIMAFIATTFGLGTAVSAAIATLFTADRLAPLVRLGPAPLRLLAVLALLATAALVLLCRAGRIRIWRISIALPRPDLAMLQIALTALDLVAAAATLWVFLPPHSIDFGTFAAIYIAALAAGVIGHTPAGLGVFDAVLLLALRSLAPTSQIAAALVLYRAIYFGLPLLLSAALLALVEMRSLSVRPLAPAAGRIVRSAAQLSPAFLGVVTFCIGVILVVSGATPTFKHRLALLSVRLPLALVEASHFFGSLFGVILMFIARDLFRRQAAAWWIALVIAALSLAFSLMKGLAYVEAVLLGLLLTMLLATRHQFSRRASLLLQPFTARWFMAVALVLAGGSSIALFAFRDVAYTQDLWWQFEFNAQAPRALRALLGMCILAVAIGVWNLLRAPSGRVTRPSAVEMARAASIAAAQQRGEAILAQMGDKSLLFSLTGRSFLMFSRRGRSWIALYDPFGDPAEAQELIWRFAELADEHGGRAAFYQVRAESLPLYLDAGLRILKLGEEARIDLANFTLEGSERSHLRYALKRGEREGLEFSYCPAGRAQDILADIKRVSDDWLARRRASEKGFSVAAFETAFVSAQTIALVRRRGEVIAFASVMSTTSGGEAVIGLMRHAADASPLVMEYLFTRLILALQADGYKCLDLGMAPLSGFEPRPLASRWHRLAILIGRYGGVVYNFQGLRMFKGKFRPAWEPRYLAASGTLGPFIALVDVAALVAGGVRSAAR